MAPFDSMEGKPIMSDKEQPVAFSNPELAKRIEDRSADMVEFGGDVWGKDMQGLDFPIYQEGDSFRFTFKEGEGSNSEMATAIRDILEGDAEIHAEEIGDTMVYMDMRNVKKDPRKYIRDVVEHAKQNLKE